MCPPNSIEELAAVICALLAAVLRKPLCILSICSPVTSDNLSRYSARGISTTFEPRAVAGTTNWTLNWGFRRKSLVKSARLVAAASIHDPVLFLPAHALIPPRLDYTLLHATDSLFVSLLFSQREFGSGSGAYR